VKALIGQKIELKNGCGTERRVRTIRRVHECYFNLQAQGWNCRFFQSSSCFHS